MQGTYVGLTDAASAVLTTDDQSDLPTDARLWYVDADSGEVWTREPQDGDDPASSAWTNEGHWLPPGDGEAPSQVTGVVVTPVSVQQSDGAYVPGFEVSWDAVPEADVIGYEVQYDLAGTTWATPFDRRTGIDVLSIIVLDGVIGNTSYDFRVRAADTDSLSGPWSNTVTSVALGDNDAPEVPTDVVAVPGFRSVGAVWSRGSEPDFDFFQVRYFPSASPTDWTIIQTKASRLIITGLDPDVEYGVQVRSIDRSGNVRTSLADPTAVKYLEQDEAGWSTTATATPSLILPADLAVGTLVAQFISSGVLDASTISAGTLTVGGPGSPVSFAVDDEAANRLAVWSNDGLVVMDPTDNSKALWIFGDSIKFTDEYTGDPGTTTWQTAIDSTGINAAAILFGTEAGGHNRVRNAGMEMQAFPTTARSSKVWTVTTDWDDATSTVNLNVSGASLTMTSAS